MGRSALPLLGGGLESHAQRVQSKSAWCLWREGRRGSLEAGPSSDLRPRSVLLRSSESGGCTVECGGQGVEVHRAHGLVWRSVSPHEAAGDKGGGKGELRVSAKPSPRLTRARGKSAATE